MRGRRYNREKKAAHDGGKGQQRSGDHFEPHLTERTAERHARDAGVSPATIKRDAAAVARCAAFTASGGLG